MSDAYTPDTPLSDITLPWDTVVGEVIANDTATTFSETPATIADDVKRHAVKLATLRHELAVRDEAIKAARRGFEETIAPQLRNLEALKREVDVLEGTVKQLALMEYERSKKQNKKPCPGVEVKVGTVYQYDREKAWAWAQEKGMCIVPAQLDEDAFIKIAKAAPLPFVTTREEPKVTLAKDLIKALDGAA